jgi:hypothetical protein
MLSALTAFRSFLVFMMAAEYHATGRGSVQVMAGDAGWASRGLARGEGRCSLTAMRTRAEVARKWLGKLTRLNPASGWVVKSELFKELNLWN